ncbi:hypothetical protein [Plasmodium yoelii yoelii]|uniref:Uncharacterized protein n=1 Tax=Plasmodium yoelii yoelii TaxID=73239 RepID=Q7RHM3_PLAYO|nr:hypothetical protein [Plasmodium yoelii yoelii]
MRKKKLYEFVDVGNQQNFHIVMIHIRLDKESCQNCVFIENGDNVGPFVAKLVSYKLSEDERLKREKYNEKYIKIDKKIGANQYSALNKKLNYTRFMNFNTYTFNNNKFKKSMLFSFGILASALLYDQKEKLKYFLQINKKVIKDIEIKRDHVEI